jgi:hypothetical protein
LVIGFIGLLLLLLCLYSPLLGHGRSFSFLILNTVGRNPLTGDQPVARPLPTHRTAQTQNKRTQISMPRVGFESTTPAFERTKTVFALACAATVIGIIGFLKTVNTSNYKYLTDSRTLQFTTARTESSQSAVFTSRCLVTASNAVDSSASGFSSLLASDCLTINPWLQDCHATSNSSSVVARASSCHSTIPTEAH